MWAPTLLPHKYSLWVPYANPRTGQPAPWPYHAHQSPAARPCRTLGRAYQRLLFHQPDIQDRVQLWTGLWTVPIGPSSNPNSAPALPVRGNGDSHVSAHGLPEGSRNSGNTINSMSTRQPCSLSWALPLPPHRPARPRWYPLPHPSPGSLFGEGPGLPRPLRPTRRLPPVLPSGASRPPAEPPPRLDVPCLLAPNSALTRTVPPYARPQLLIEIVSKNKLCLVKMCVCVHAYLVVSCFTIFIWFNLSINLRDNF